MADVRPEEDLELRAVGIGPAIESVGVGRVVGLASKVEVVDEQIADIFGTLDAAGRIVVQIVDSTCSSRAVLGCERRVEILHTAGKPLATILVDQLDQQRSIEVGRIHFLQRGTIAFLPVPDQIGVESARPSYAAFEKSHLERGKAPRHSAQEHRLTYRLARRGEVTDMVIDEVGW